MNVLQETNRRILRQGIVLFHNLYMDRRGYLIGLREALSKKKEGKVRIKYDERDLSRISVLDPFENKYVSVPAVDQEYTKNLTLSEHTKNVKEIEEAKRKVMLTIRVIVENHKRLSTQRSARQSIRRKIGKEPNEKTIK